MATARRALVKLARRNSCYLHRNRRLVLFQKAFSSQEQTTVDSDEVFKFSQLCNEFWDINGPFQALHTMNSLRVPLIKQALLRTSRKEERHSAKPLQNKHILDIGCGGGILCEPLARLGASVTGIDASDEAISVAEYHARHDPEVSSRVNYRCSTAEELIQDSQTFDAVVASEVIEHVGDQKLFTHTCAQLTKPGGSLIFTTISKTLKSYLLAIGAAEYVLGVVERGTHDWHKFISPDELASYVIASGLTVDKIQGLQYNPFSRVWSNTSDIDVGYALVARNIEHTRDGPVKDPLT